MGLRLPILASVAVTSLGLFPGRAWPQEAPAEPIAQPETPPPPSADAPPRNTEAPPPSSVFTRPPSQWGAPPGEPAPEASVEDFVASVAHQRGVRRADQLRTLEEFYRRRKIGIVQNLGSSYQFVVGEPGRPVAEHEFITSFHFVTGSQELDRYRPDGGSRVLAATGAAVGGITAYFGTLIALGCAGRQSIDAPRACNVRTPATVAVVGGVIGLVSLVSLATTSAPSNPDVHRIPMEQAPAIVARYNRALVDRAAQELKSGAALGALDDKPRRRAAPAMTLGFDLGSLQLRF